MNIKKTMEFIHGVLKFGSVLGLDSIKRLTEKLSNPQDGLKFIHIAGTNGKGSVASIIASCLTESGKKTGLYTSPALVRFSERMRIDGAEIQEDKLCLYAEKVKSACEALVSEGHPHPTEFEIVTAIAFLFFKDENCDYVVLETGMGGRLDATNVINNPVLTVITSVSLDHTDRLGDTIEKIAVEKCGIIKNAPTVTTKNQPRDAMKVIMSHDNVTTAEPLEILEENISHLLLKSDIGNLKLSLTGSHQAENAGIALASLKLLGIKPEYIKKGFERVCHKARLEVINDDPLVVLDGAHNPSAMENLSKFTHLVEGKKTLIIGMLRDKDYSLCAKIIAGCFDRIIAVDVNSPRALPKEELCEVFKKLNENSSFMELRDALGEIKKGESFFIAGSLYMAGEVLEIWETLPWNM